MVTAALLNAQTVSVAGRGRVQRENVPENRPDGNGLDAALASGGLG